MRNSGLRCDAPFPRCLQATQSPRETAFSGRKSLIFAAPGGREDGSVANSSFGLMESHRLRQRRNRIPGVIPARAARVRRQQVPRRRAANPALRADDRGRDRRFRGVSGRSPPARSPRPAVRGRTARRPGRPVQPGGAGGDLRGSAAPGLGEDDLLFVPRPRAVRLEPQGRSRTARRAAIGGHAAHLAAIFLRRRV